MGYRKFSLIWKRRECASWDDESKVAMFEPLDADERPPEVVYIECPSLLDFLNWGMGDSSVSTENSKSRKTRGFIKA